MDLCRMHGISDAIFYNWRTKYGGMEVSEAKRLKQLEEENRKLEQMPAEILLDNKALKVVRKGSSGHVQESRKEA